LLAPQDGELILDACAAPGGKTCHILDLAASKVIAADIDGTRLSRVQENLTRLKCEAELVEGDLSKEQTLAEYAEFDRILLDAPCSATGVIRRHPDIKWLRREEDIDNLASLQSAILDTLWNKLKVGGHLLYATCSILPEENSLQMQSFLQRHADATRIDLNQSSDESDDNPGWQILPGNNNMDGFYYCLLQKQ
jgi:16S rRNA (cytosine967-C5)-methyltransferase